MKIYNEHITLQSTQTRQVFNITSQIKAAMEKSSFRDGIILVSSLHSNSATIVNDDEPGLLEDLDAWLNKLAPAATTSNTRAISKASPRSISRAYFSTTRPSWPSPKDASISAPGNPSSLSNSTAYARSASSSK